MVRFPTVGIACVSYVPCSASVGAPGAASGVEFCMVGSGEAWVRPLLAGVMGLPGTAKRSAVLLPILGQRIAE